MASQASSKYIYPLSTLLARRSLTYRYVFRTQLLVRKQK